MYKEKKDFIFKKGVLGVGLPIALLMSVVTAYQVPGNVARFQGFNVNTFLLSLMIFVPIFMIAGYLWGLFVYNHMKKK